MSVRRIGAHGLRLIQEFEGAPRLKARLCEGGRWELSWGVTFRPDGSPIEEDETCTLEDAEMLFRHAIGVFEDAVSQHVQVPIDQNAFDALCAFAYNVGIENFRASSVLRFVNANRIYDAAGSFGMWLYATKNGHKQALRGLLRRRYAEACLFLGYQWDVACDDDAIRLAKEEPAGGVGTDKIIHKTPWADVLQVAQRYPLDPVHDELFVESGEALTPQTAPEEVLVLDHEAAPEALPVSGPGQTGPGLPSPSSEPASVSLPNPPVLNQPRGSVSAGPASASPQAGGEGRGVPRDPPQKSPELQHMRPEPKNPARSTTIWGGLFAALAPQFDQIGNLFIAKSGVFGPPFMVLGVIMVVLGRIGATQPISNSAPIRSQS